MDQLNNLVFSVIGGLITVGIIKIFHAYRKKSIRDDLEIIELEKTVLEGMKKSSVEMNRNSFRAIFFVFTLISLANVISHSGQIINSTKLVNFTELITSILWLLAAATSIKLWKRYNNLKDFKEACGRMDQKIEKLKVKLEKS